MRNTRSYLITLKLFVFFIVIGITVLIQLITIPAGIDQLIKNCYYHICVQWFVILSAWMLVFSRKKTDIFEPIVLLSAVHFVFFEITPLICIRDNNISYFGVNVWNGCIKATYISTVGYLALLFAYFYVKNNPTAYEEELEFISNSDKVLVFNYAVWVFSFICGLILIYGYGLNFRYLITGGMIGLTESTNEKSIFGFLGIIFYAMIPSYLYIFELSKIKAIKIVLFYLTFMSYFVRGFRFIMIACLLSPVIFIYLKKNKRPKFRTIVIMLMLLAVFSSFVQFTRTAIRSGIGAGDTFIKLINFNSVRRVIVDNFEIVKTYYAIVDKYPSMYPYTLGTEIFLSTALLLIPSAIWHGKPAPPIYQVVENSLTSRARVAGTSFPYLGEYYFEFGVIGVIFFMVVLGVLLRKLNKYMYTNKIHDYILYASLS